MTTNNALNTPLAGATGTVHFVGANSPTLITPTLGAATATSIAFSPTTGGIIGTTAADNPTAGDVGQIISSNIASASAITFSNNTSKDLTSINLTAGDWDVFANVQNQAGTAGPPTFASIIVWTSTSSATPPDISLSATFFGNPAVNAIGMEAPYQRYNVSGSTTVYVSAKVTGTGTLAMCGGIYAVRVR